jgi:hypothetical protein
MIEERMDLGIAKRLIEDLMDLEERIQKEHDAIDILKTNHDRLNTSLFDKLVLHVDILNVYKKLNIEIYRNLLFMVEAEMKYLGCSGNDKPKDTNTNTDAQHNGALESSSQEK